jgi:hypothetical protein
MDMCTDIAIHQDFVIHVLDNSQPAAQYSAALTPLPDGLQGVLEKYLLALLRPEFRRKRFGRFRPDSPVRHEYQRLLTASTGGRVDGALFLDVSQRLAAQLFTAMRQTPQNGSRSRPGEVTPGDLLVGLFYSRAPEPSTTPYLFLIKVDLESGLQRQLRALANGSVQTVLTACDGLLPKLSAEHIHNSALIQYRNDPSTYDVLMTDPQGGKQGVAKFFAEDFLQTEPFQTPAEQAELLFMRTHAWVTEHAESLSPQEQHEILQSVRSHITAQAASAAPLAPRELAAAIPLRELRPAETVQALRHSFQETVVPPAENGHNGRSEHELALRIVPPRVAKTRITYELDGGVHLSGDQDALERLFVRPPQRQNGVTEFTIRTTTFRPLW